MQGHGRVPATYHAQCPQKLVENEHACLVIGAGVSVSLASNAESKRLVTWRGFLDQLAKTVANMFGLEADWYLRVKALLYGSADGGIVHLGKAAEMIEHFVTTANMGAAHTSISPYARYHHLVFKILHAIRADKNSVLASVLHRLNVPIFTTNYDVLLEDATGRFTLSIDDLLRAQRQYRLAPQQHPLADHQLYVFHLHGTVGGGEIFCGSLVGSLKRVTQACSTTIPSASFA